MAENWDFGRAVHGYAWRTPNARANVLITHGFAEYAERYFSRYHLLVPKLNAFGFDVFGWDMRGHGRSPGARGVADMNGAVADHRAARAKLQDKPLFVYGHSLGGLVTAASVAEDASGVAGVVLSAPALLITAPAHLKAIAGFVSAIAPGARLAPPLDASGLSRIPEEVAAYKSDPMISDPRVPAKTGATAIAASEAAWAHYAHWRVPTLVFHGEKDTLTDPEGSKRFFNVIPADDKTIQLYPEGRHELLNDLDRDAVMELVTSWLQARAPQN